MDIIWLVRTICDECIYLDCCADGESCKAHKVLRELLMSGKTSAKDIEKVVAELERGERR